MTQADPPHPSERPLRVLAWGTYDLGKPRVRILLRGLQENGVALTECHAQVWSDVDDKSQIGGLWARLLLLLRWLGSYPVLVWRFMCLPKQDVVLVCYLGHLDVLMLWPFAKLRGTPVAWDAFLSLYDTVVEDRRLVASRNPVAWLLHAWEWLACRAADVVILDTRAHGDYFANRYRVRPGKIQRVFVGAEPEHFHPQATRKTDPQWPFTVLFYGQCIPLHGLETIVQAAALTADRQVDWVLIGQGQESDRIESLVQELGPLRISWVPWVPYRELSDQIARADLCLGIFGASGKAARVIPNKVFQILTAGRPLITRDSPAVRELLDPAAPGVLLVPPGDPRALADAVLNAAEDPESTREQAHHRDLSERISPAGIGAALIELLEPLSKPARTDAARTQRESCGQGAP